jgi:hypothetical protein
MKSPERLTSRRPPYALAVVRLHDNGWKAPLRPRGRLHVHRGAEVRLESTFHPAGLPWAIWLSASAREQAGCNPARRSVELHCHGVRQWWRRSRPPSSGKAPVGPLEEGPPARVQARSRRKPAWPCPAARTERTAAICWDQYQGALDQGLLALTESVNPEIAIRVRLASSGTSARVEVGRHMTKPGGGSPPGRPTPKEQPHQCSARLPTGIELPTRHDTRCVTA